MLHKGHIRVTLRLRYGWTRVTGAESVMKKTNVTVPDKVDTECVMTS